MPHRYPPHEQARIMMILRQNNNDVTATHQQTGVPKRTLRHWLQRERENVPNYDDWRQQQQEKQADLPPPPKDELTQDEDNNVPPADVDPADLRVRLVSQVDHLTDQFTTASPREAYFITLAITRLLDQIARLNTVLTPPPKPAEEQRARLVYRDLQGNLREWGDWDHDDETDPPAPQQKIPPT